jgi:hypothetical protein
MSNGCHDRRWCGAHGQGTGATEMVHQALVLIDHGARYEQAPGI